MKAKKLISAILSVGILASCIATAGAAEQTTSYNDYQNMLAQTKAENKYGLAKTVNEGKILQAFNWSYENVMQKMEKVADQGFTTIQVSPPNEIKMPTKGVHVVEPANANGEAPNGWWMFYQPAGFQLNESEDNALGTKDQFVEMCAKADEYGLKIIVDAVINHMGTDDDHTGEVYNNNSVDPMDHVNSRAAEFEPEILNAKAFHSPWADCTYVENMGAQYPQYNADGSPKLSGKCPNCGTTLSQLRCTKKGCNGKAYVYGGSADINAITESNTRHCTSGLPDLDTSQKVVQDAIYDYLKELVEAGADGFRIDAAKHIETSEDIAPYASDFWENTLMKIKAEYPEKELFAYGEILNKCGDGRPFSMYTSMMDVTDSASFWGIKDAVCNNGNGGNSIPTYPNYEDAGIYGANKVKFTKENVIQWNESHDTYIDGSTSFFTVEQRNKIWALTAARQTITGVYLARPDDRAGNSSQIATYCKDILLGEARETSWATSSAVKAVNQFSNYYGAAEESLSVQEKVTVIERGGTGAVLVNLNGTTKDVKLYTNTLSDGKYVDAATGNEFTVTDGFVSGKIGATGVAAIYYAEDEKPEPREAIDFSKGFPVKEGYTTVVFSNNRNWSDVYYYCWKENGDNDEEMSSWPGSSMIYARVNEHNEKQYYAFIPEKYNSIIFNNGAYEQSVDTTMSGNMGYYLISGFKSPFKLGTFDPGFVKDEPATEPSSPSVTEPTPPVTEPSVPVAQPKLSLKKKSVNAGQTTTAVVSNKNGKKPTYYSSNTTVAKIDKNSGKITALKKGTTTITAKISGKKLTAKLTVKTDPAIKDGKKTLKNNSTVTVKKGGSKTLTITGKVSNIKNSAKLKSTKYAKITSKTSQAKIVIKGKKKGNTTLTVVINKTKTYKIKVRVK